MIIFNYGRSTLHYNPWQPEERDEAGNILPMPNVHPHRTMFTDVECFYLTKEQIHDEIHITKDPPYNDVNGNQMQLLYHINFKDYTIMSQDKAFMIALFKIIIKFKNGTLPADYDFFKEQPEVFI